MTIVSNQGVSLIIKQKKYRLVSLILIGLFLVAVGAYHFWPQTSSVGQVNLPVRLANMLESDVSSASHVTFRKTITTEIASTMPTTTTTTTTDTSTPDQCDGDYSKSITNTGPGSHNSIDVDVSCHTEGTTSGGTTSISITNNTQQEVSSGDVSDGGSSGDVSVSDHSSVTVNQDSD